MRIKGFGFRMPRGSSFDIQLLLFLLEVCICLATLVSLMLRLKQRAPERGFVSHSVRLCNGRLPTRPASITLIQMELVTSEPGHCRTVCLVLAWRYPMVLLEC